MGAAATSDVVRKDAVARVAALCRCGSPTCAASDASIVWCIDCLDECWIDEAHALHGGGGWRCAGCGDAVQCHCYGRTLLSLEMCRSHGRGLGCCDGCTQLHFELAPSSPFLASLHACALQLGAAPLLADLGAFLRHRCVLFELTAEVECIMCSCQFFHWHGVWSMQRDSSVSRTGGGISQHLTCERLPSAVLGSCRPGDLSDRLAADAAADAAVCGRTEEAVVFW